MKQNAAVLIAIAAIAIAPPLRGSSTTSPAAELHALWNAADYHRALRRAHELRIPTTGSPEAQAWAILNEAGAGFFNEPVEKAEALFARYPSSPWAAFAQAFALVSRGDEPVKAVAMTRKLVLQQPDNIDFAWLYARALGRTRKHLDAVAYVDSASHRYPNASALIAEKAFALMLEYFGMPKRDSLIAEQARVAAIAVQHNPSATPNALAIAGSVLNSLGPINEEYATCKRAADLAPGSTTIHESYWLALSRLAERTADEKQREFEADHAKVTAVAGETPELLKSASTAYRRLKLADRARELESRILAQYPTSVAAQQLRFAALTAFGDSVNKKLVPDSTAGAAEYKRRLWTFARTTPQPNTYVLGQAYYALYPLVTRDSASDVDLLELTEGLNKYAPFAPTQVGIVLPLRLADRKLRLAFAEQLVQSKIARRQRDIEMAREGGFFATVGDYADAADMVKAMTNDALGWIHYNQGRTADAEKELAEATSLASKYSMTLYHLGRIREQQGKLDEAKRLYARGAVTRYMGAPESRGALERLHIAEGGSPQTFESYLASLREKERQERRASIASSRSTNGPVIPDFSLEKLEGGMFDSKSTRGKFMVVNFWGTWCGPCVAEAADIQKFYDRFKADTNVVFVTINNDSARNDVIQFMKKRALTFPVLYDKNFVYGDARIASFPTTWFVERDGRIAFTHKGASQDLLEEFIWRVEMLEGTGGTTTTPSSTTGARTEPVNGASTKLTPADSLPVLADDPKLVQLGLLPPHDQLPYLLKDIALTSAQRDAIMQLRRSYRPRFDELRKIIRSGDSNGPEPFFANRRIEGEERDAARALLDQPQRAAFDVAVDKMLKRRESMISVRPPG